MAVTQTAPGFAARYIMLPASVIWHDRGMAKAGPVTDSSSTATPSNDLLPKSPMKSPETNNERLSS